MVAKPEITIYTKASCGFCHKAKDLLNKINLSFNEIAVDNNPDLRLRLQKENNGYSTVPMIFINGKFIGGCSELEKLVASNTLQQFL